MQFSKKHFQFHSILYKYYINGKLYLIYYESMNMNYTWEKEVIIDNVFGS